MGLFSNLPETASATEIANAYRKRRWIETALQEVRTLLAGEIQTLAYSPAMLFALRTAFVVYNIMQCMYYVLSTAITQPKQPLKIS
jgi:hypothetical protein